MTTKTKDQEEDVRKRLRKGGRGITLKYDGECADCGAFLPKGSTARWYGRGRLYGYDCHGDKAKPKAQDKVKSGVVQGDLFSDEPLHVTPAPENQECYEQDHQPETTGEYVPKAYDCTIH